MFVLFVSPTSATFLTILTIGYLLVAIIQWGLYHRAATKSDELCLNELEKLLVLKEKKIWLSQAALGVLSTIIALVFMSSFGYLAGIVYGLSPALLPLLTMQTRKKIEAMQSESNN